MEINFDGLQKFLEEFKNVTSEAKQVKSELAELIEEFKALRNVTNNTTLVLLIDGKLTPETKKTLIDSYPELKDDEEKEVKKGQVFRNNDRLYEVLKDHKKEKTWKLDKVTDLYKDITPKDTITVKAQKWGTKEYWSKGDLVDINGVIWESLENNNNMPPNSNPRGWKKR